MSSQKYISVKSCGNPQSAGGFMTLTLFNSPNFLIEDRAISGFQANSYFFSLMIEKTQVIYKLYKNNVRSFGSIRPGTLVIAFSVPRDYGFEKGINPFNVMISLKDKFLSTCMTCRDPKLETYEFNEGQIDSKVLDEVAMQFPLVPHDGPYCEMSPTGPIGHLILPENKIEQFMNDIHYRELQQYSEIFIAEEVEARVSAQSKESSPVPDLEIPRKPQYKILVDGVMEPVVTDINKTLTYFSKAQERFYDNDSISFTIRDLLAGINLNPSRIQFDSIREEVKVSTKGLEIPKVRKFQLVLEPHQDFFKNHQSGLQLTYDRNEKIKLNKDLLFELTGEQIAYCDRPNAFSIKYYSEDQLNYSFSSPRIDGDRLVYDVVKKYRQPEPPSHKPGGNRRNPYGEPQQRVAPRQFVFHFEDGDEEIFDKRQTLRFEVKSGNGNDAFSTIVTFSKKAKANFEGILDVPEQIQNPMTIEFRTPDGDLYRTRSVSIESQDNGRRELSLSYFDPVKERFIDKKISKVKGLIGMLAATLLLLGIGSGYLLRGCTNQKTILPLTEKKVQKDSGDSSGKGGDQDNQQHNELTEQQAKNDINAWKSTLQKKDVTFAEIDDIYNLYENNGYSQYCSEQDRKIIEDYHQVKTLIENGSFDELKKVGEMQWAISMKHKIAIERATVRFENKRKFNSTESSEAKAQFMNNYSDYKSFSDIKPYNNESGSVGTGGGRKSKDHQKAPGGGTPPPPPPPDRG